MVRAKVLLVLLLAGTISTQLSGQLWFDIGAKGSYGITMMLNNNIFDDRDVDHKVSWGYTYGVSLGVHFDDHNGILVEYMRARGNQDFDDERMGAAMPISYEWNTNDVLLLYRYTGYGGFFEIGPRVSFVSDVSSIYHEGPSQDVTGQFESTWYSGVLGFGTYLAGSDLFSIQAGIRLHYQFGDMLNESGQEANLPVYEEYETYKKTSAIAAQFHIEFNYAFGRFAKESCRDRWKLILFQ